ncbi:MAG: uracil-DNA glycosylase [Alphaproteobacteria bacterium]
MAGDAREALRWLTDCGVDETIDEAPRNRFGAPMAPARSEKRSPEPPPISSDRQSDSRAANPVSLASTASLIEQAKTCAGAAASVEELGEVVANFEGCALRKTAKNTVFADGNPAADLMLVGEAPGAEEDRRGVPFVGAAGHLLDRMLAAIDRDRTSTYISNLLFWRPPGNRNPTLEEIALCRPFVERHIALVAPRILVCVGGVSAKTLLDRSEGITRLRGRWYEVRPDGFDRSITTTAIYHPAYLLRQPAQKRHAWHDLRDIRAKLEIS